MRQTMTRLIGGLALSALAGLAPAFAAEVNLRLAHYLPPTHMVASTILPGWAERVKEASGGRIEVEIVPAGQLLKVDEIYDGVKAGVPDLGWSMPGATPGRFPVMSVLELPFLFSNGEDASRIVEEMREDGLMDKEFEGVKVLFVHTHSPSIINTQTKIEKLEDLAGKRIRFPSPAARMMLERLGATPVGVPAPQAYERGLYT